MILVSLLTCLLGIGLFALDLTTDIKFSIYMLNVNLNQTTRTESSNETNSDVFLNKHYFNLPSLKSAHDECFYNLSRAFKRNKKWKVLEEEEDYQWTGRFSLWHCIQPFVITIIVFMSINCKKVKNCSVTDIQPPEVPDCLKNSEFCQNRFNRILCFIPFKILWPLGNILIKCLGSSLLFLGSVVPSPALTNVYRFNLDVRCHIARSQADFKTKIVCIEKKIREHEAIGKL